MDPHGAPSGAGLLRRVDSWLLAPAPPARLAVLRCAIGCYAMVNLVVSFGEFRRLAGRPASEFEPVGLAVLMHTPLSPLVLWALYVSSLISGVGFMVGFRFRLSAPVFGLCTLAWASYHSSWGQMLHFEHLLTLHVLLLAFSPAADVLSVDAPIARQRTLDRGGCRWSVRYGWPIRLLAIATVTTYALAGVAKIRTGGLAWVDGTTLANHIAYSATRLDLLGEPRPPLAAVVVGWEGLLRPMAIAALAVELLAPLALLGGWWRRIWVPSVVLFHLGTLTTMFVFFPYNGLGFAVLALYRVEAVVERLTSIRSRARTDL